MKNLTFRAVINGHRSHIQLIAKTWETRSSWGHEVDLFINGNFAGSYRHRYYNRTWEAWTYQAVMQEVISQYCDERHQDDRNRWRRDHGQMRIEKADSRKMENYYKGLKKRLYAHLDKANKNAW